MDWRKVTFREIAPPKSSSILFTDEEAVWHLTLDQIEGHTGRIIEKVIAPASKAGTSTYTFDTGNVLYSKLRPYLNKVVVPEEVGIATTELVPLRPKQKILDRSFLAYYLRSEQFLNFANHAVEGARMPRVPMDQFWQHEIPLPPPSEQRRIVEILDQADALRRRRAEADAKAARILPALFIKMFGDPATNPMGWDMGPLGKVTEAVNYGLAEQLSRTDTAETGIPIVRIANVLVNGEVDLSDMRYWPADDALKAKLGLKKQDLLFNWRNGSQEHVGKTAIWEEEGAYIFVSFLLRIRCNEQGIRPYYLWTLLNMLRANGYFSEASRMQINRKFNATELSQLLIPNPPSELQDQFQNTVLGLRELTRQASVRVTEVEKLFTKLLRHAFSGELTAGWREAHIRELLAEMEQQAHWLGLDSTTATSNGVEYIDSDSYQQETLPC